MKSSASLPIVCCVQRAAMPALAEKVSISSFPSTTRSWLPARHTSQERLASSTHSSGWAP